MAKILFSLAKLALILLILIPNSGQAQKQGNSGDSIKTWCVAKPSASDEQLIANIEFSCNYVDDQCSILEPGQPCFLPYTLNNHASVAMNLYYQSVGGHNWNCDFNDTGLPTTSDPSSFFAMDIASLLKEIENGAAVQPRIIL
ncbi:hypothetical protein ACFE04_030891 [Oxalis oulophora]